MDKKWKNVDLENDLGVFQSDGRDGYKGDELRKIFEQESRPISPKRLSLYEEYHADDDARAADARVYLESDLAQVVIWANREVKENKGPAPYPTLGWFAQEILSRYKSVSNDLSRGRADRAVLRLYELGRVVQELEDRAEWGGSAVGELRSKSRKIDGAKKTARDFKPGMTQAVEDHLARNPGATFTDTKRYFEKFESGNPLPVRTEKGLYDLFVDDDELVQVGPDDRLMRIKLDSLRSYWRAARRNNGLS